MSSLAGRKRFFNPLHDLSRPPEQSVGRLPLIFVEQDTGFDQEVVEATPPDLTFRYLDTKVAQEAFGLCHIPPLKRIPKQAVNKLNIRDIKCRSL